MDVWKTVFLLGLCIILCCAREPFKPKSRTVPYMVHFASRFRGLCAGFLVSRSAVMTAACCVANPIPGLDNRAFLNVVLGSPYRHPRRGIRVQVSRIVLPFLGDNADRVYLIQKSVALLILKRKVPDILAEIPTRAIGVDYLGEETLKLQKECLVAGWHFFYKGDLIFPGPKFHLQRNLRVQFMNIAKQSIWCEALVLKFRNGMSHLGVKGEIDNGEVICIRDGMYGAPYVCQGKVVGIMSAPDAQWTNCTGQSNIIHLLSNAYLRPFFDCVNKLFEPELPSNWGAMKEAFYEEGATENYDYMHEMYDKVLSGETSESQEGDDCST